MWLGCDALCCIMGVLIGVSIRLTPTFTGLYPGYIILRRDGEGEGVREETILLEEEAPARSQFFRRSSSSCLVGPCSGSAEKIQKENERKRKEKRKREKTEKMKPMLRITLSVFSVFLPLLLL